MTQTVLHDSLGTIVSDANDLCEARMGSPPMRMPNAGGIGESW